MSVCVCACASECTCVRERACVRVRACVCVCCLNIEIASIIFRFSRWSSVSFHRLSSFARSAKLARVPGAQSGQVSRGGYVGGHPVRGFFLRGLKIHYASSSTRAAGNSVHEAPAFTHRIRAFASLPSCCFCWFFVIRGTGLGRGELSCGESWP